MSNDGLTNGDFARHKALIEYRFDQLDKAVESLSVDVKEIRGELVGVRLKIAAFGGGSGLLGWAIPQIIQYLAQRGG